MQPNWVPVGVDFSPSSTGVVLGHTSGHLLYEVVVWPPNPDGVRKSWRERRAAAYLVADSIDARAGDTGGVPFVVLEDYAPGRWAGTSHIEIAESRGYLLEQFVSRGWPFVLIHPMRLKGFIKAKTKAESVAKAKELMATTGCPSLPEGLTPRQQGDLCDAFVLWRIGTMVLFSNSSLPDSWVSGDSALGLPRNSYYEPFLRED